MMDFHSIGLFLGLDVQVKRACSYFVLNTGLEYVDSGWLTGNKYNEICLSLKEIVDVLEKIGDGKVAIGIDAPRIGLDAPREYYWKRGKWKKKTSQEKGYGRHCEVVLKALNIANPQWTPLAENAPSWMQLGFKLFKSLTSFENLFEVFPSASYTMLKNKKQPTVSISFENFVDGPKDMLDACIGAFTVHEFIKGRGSEVGGGDRLGTIVLPTKIPVPSSHPVLSWPKVKQVNTS